MKLFLRIISIGFVLWPLLSFSQYDSPIEEVQHGRYLTLQSQIDYLEQRVDQLQGIKIQVDDVISQVRERPVATFTQDAERYQELEVLVPAATAYSQELARRQQQLDELRRQKLALRTEVVTRRGTLPVWWVE
jgi:chromosome segregation ATPase